MLLAELTIPFPPSVNHIYGGFGNKRWLKKEVLVFRQLVRVAVIEQCSRFSLPIVGAIALDLQVFYPHDNRKRDLDNLIKSTQDALQIARLLCDDRQIVSLSMTSRLSNDFPDGGVGVRISRSKKPEIETQ